MEKELSPATQAGMCPASGTKAGVFCLPRSFEAVDSQMAQPSKPCPQDGTAEGTQLQLAVLFVFVMHTVGKMFADILTDICDLGIYQIRHIQTSIAVLTCHEMPITYYHIVNPCHHALKISDMLEASG